jgi:ligand-binding SRPBCC domain-containing protein
VVLVGLLGKLFGPVGFAAALARGAFPPAFGLTILTNDLVWWVPFALILRDAARHHRAHGPRERFVWESHFDAPPAAVFAAHERPDALQHLVPPWESVRVAESPGSLAVGSRVVLRGRAGPIPVRWVAVHTEYDPPHLFADRQESGPFAFWYHRHHFLDDGRGGTVLRDEVEYRLPFGALGRMLGGRFVRRRLERMFAYRHAATRGLVEPVRGAAVPAGVGRDT